MKKVFALFAILVAFSIGMTTSIFAQDEVAAEPYEMTTAEIEETEYLPAEEEEVAAATTIITGPDAPVMEEEGGLHQVLKQYVIEGGPVIMGILLFCLILGIALCIERIIYLSLSDTNTKKLLAAIDEAMEKGGVPAAMEVCRDTRGPVASIFYQGLSRYDQGIEVVEKTVVSYGSVQTGLMEKGLPWISLFIAIAPMIGFMGTVLGMIEAFDRIQQVGDISASIIAGGIKIALITTVMGLTVAIILQVLFNYVITKMDAITGEMEDASISLLDLIVKYNVKSQQQQ